MNTITYTTTRLLLPLFLALLFVPSASAKATKEQEEALKIYFNKCGAKLYSSEVLDMCDTLYKQAVEVGSTRYQALSRVRILDYYYFQGNKDKILELVAEVKRLSKELNEQESYYFAWGSRLIAFYLKSGMPNHALLEAQQMLKEAQSENYQLGIAECYKAMANIQQMQLNTEEAIKNFRKLINIIEKIDPQNVNIPIYYTSLIDHLMQTSQLKEAEKSLIKLQDYFDKAEEVSSYQLFCLYQSYLRFYIDKKEIAHAKVELGKIEKIFATNKEMSIYSIYLSDCRLRYYIAAKENEKALAVIDTIWKKHPTSETKLIMIGKKGDIYWNMNNRAAAAECYREYILGNDSVRKLSMQKSANEIAGLLNLHQLEQEKQLLMIDIQHRKLNTTYWALAALMLILIAAAVVIVHVFRLNRQLKESKQVVLEQNQELLHVTQELRQSSQELKIAKEQAENSSNMKTEFIQNITHEVRTPLNSIVGFSQVLVEFFDNPEAEEYSSLITMNSNYLLKLFGDVLELSNIDQIEKLCYDTESDIKDSCQLAIQESGQYIKEGVTLIFRPLNEELRICTNPNYVIIVLNNLLHNAAKFTEKGSIVLEYTVSPSEGIIRYSVTDTGCGIPLDKQEVVFERFMKLDDFMQGSGLGLSVSRAVAEKMGGTLFIDSAYTSGSRFVLTLPYIPA